MSKLSQVTCYLTPAYQVEHSLALLRSDAIVNRSLSKLAKQDTEFWDSFMKLATAHYRFAQNTATESIESFQPQAEQYLRYRFVSKSHFYTTFDNK
jgi:hypothetical protein